MKFVRTDLPFDGTCYVLFVVGQKVPKNRVKGRCPLTYPEAARAIDGCYACSPTAKPATHRLSAREGEVIKTFVFAASK